MWERNSQIRGGYMICMGMFGNGVPIGMEITRGVNRPIPKVRVMGPAVLTGVVVGTTLLGAAGRRFGAVTLLPAGATIWAFAS